MASNRPERDWICIWSAPNRQADADRGSDLLRRHRVVVAPQRHQAVARHLAVQEPFRRIGDFGKFQQVFGVSQLADRSARAGALVGNLAAELIQAQLGLVEILD